MHAVTIIDLLFVSLAAGEPSPCRACLGHTTVRGHLITVATDAC